MAQNGFFEVLICVLFMARIRSDSADDNNLLIHKYNTQGDYYDLKHGVCVRCISCTRENFKTKTPCNLHSDAICGDCEDGYVKQQQDESIKCIQSSDKNDDIAHPGGDGDLDLGSSSASYYNTTVAQKSPERINADSDSDGGKGLMSTANNDISPILSELLRSILYLVLSYGD